ncbi:Aldo/keto reductase, partial [Pholiota molesta]
MPWNTVQLSDGNIMPSIAYGTWRTGKGQQPVDSLNQAFAVGIRHVDIATSFKNSLENLGLTYIDLYLIHGPEMCDEDGIEKCWKEMEKLKDSGLAKSIGVSNFEVDHLQQVFSIAKHIPVVNQILLHPYVYA